MIITTPKTTPIHSSVCFAATSPVSGEECKKRSTSDWECFFWV